MGKSSSNSAVVETLRGNALQFRISLFLDSERTYMYLFLKSDDFTGRKYYEGW
jgi:hypothetical protein